MQVLHLPKYCVAALALISFSAHALPPANPLLKPQGGVLSAMPNPNLVNAPAPSPYLVGGGGSGGSVSASTLQAAAAVAAANADEKPESTTATNGMYVSMIFGKRAVLRAPAISHVAQAANTNFGLSLPPMTAAGAQTPGQTQAAGAVTRMTVYSVTDGQIFALSDGLRVKATVTENSVSLSSVTTKKALFYGSVDSAISITAPLPVADLQKADAKYNRVQFIRPLSTPSGVGGSVASGAVQQTGGL